MSCLCIWLGLHLLSDHVMHFLQKVPTDHHRAATCDATADMINLSLKEKSDSQVKPETTIKKEASALAGGASCTSCTTTTTTTKKQNVPSQYPDLMRSVQEIKERLDQNQNNKRVFKTQNVSTKDHQFWSTQPVPKLGPSTASN